MVSRICVTVQLLPHFPFRPALCGAAEGSGEEWTTPGGIFKGATLSSRPPPDILGVLKTIVVVILVGGVDVWSTSPRHL